MKTLSKNDKIAIACGWRLRYQWRGGGELFDEEQPGKVCWKVWIRPAGEKSPSCFTDEVVPPNYFISLDAVAKAEEKLITDLVILDWVRNLIDSIYDEGFSCTGRIRACEAALRATAAQRAETLGKTMKLW